VGLAQSPAWMVAARAVQGVGAATLAPSTLALLSASFPEGPERTRAMAAYGALAGIGTAFGLIIGGVLTSAPSWRYGFFLNVAVGLAAIVAAPRFLPETERHATRLDLAGALSSTLGAGALVFGIVHSADAGWTAASTVAALAVGVAGSRSCRSPPPRSRPPRSPRALASATTRSPSPAAPPC
jgi:MFS family permease